MPSSKTSASDRYRYWEVPLLPVLERCRECTVKGRVEKWVGNLCRACRNVTNKSRLYLPIQVGKVCEGSEKQWRHDARYRSDRVV